MAGQYHRTQQKQRLFTHVEYRAQSWDGTRNVVAARTNLRFVVTNLAVGSDAQAQARYHDYIERGTSEQPMDELKNGMHANRLSCHRSVANFWLLLHACALPCSTP